MPRHGEQIDAPSISLYSFLVSPFSTPVCHFSPSEWSNKTVGGNFGWKSNRWMLKLQTDSDARIRIRKCTEVYVSYAIYALNKAHKAYDVSSWLYDDVITWDLSSIPPSTIICSKIMIFLVWGKTSYVPHTWSLSSFQWFSLFFTKVSPTNGPTDRPTDGQTPL